MLSLQLNQRPQFPMQHLGQRQKAFLQNIEAVHSHFGINSNPNKCFNFYFLKKNHAFHSVKN